MQSANHQRAISSEVIYTPFKKPVRQDVVTVLDGIQGAQSWI